MTPAVREWMLNKARDELKQAKAELRETKRITREYGVRAKRDPAIWGDEYREHQRLVKRDAAEVELLKLVVAELTEEPPVY